MNETKLRLFAIASRLEVISKEMKTNFPGLVGSLILRFYADEIMELAQEMNELLE